MENQENKQYSNPINSFLFVFMFLALILSLVYLSKGFYTVQPSEQAVVKRFGKFNRFGKPGLNFKLPFPIEDVLIVDVENMRRMEIGYRTVSKNPIRYRTHKEESLMLTNDENIVNIEFNVLYYISNVKSFVFNVSSPESTLKKSAEAAMRQVIGDRPIDDALTDKKNEIQIDVKRILTDILNKYDTGIKISAVQLQDVFPPDDVIAAFKDVASAREDRNRLINEAKAYENSVIPKVEGDVEKILNESKGKAVSIINTALGDTSKFRFMVEEFKKTPEITKTRMYFDTMKEKLKGVKKIIVDEKEGSSLFSILKAFGAAEEAKK